MGYMPDWFVLMRVAKYLGVAPWELYEQPQIWLDLAMQFMYGEIQIENNRSRRH